MVPIPPSRLIQSMRRSRSRSRVPSRSPSRASSRSRSTERGRRDLSDEEENDRSRSASPQSERSTRSEERSIDLGRIPRKREYTTASEEVPSPPKRNKVEKRLRVVIDDPTKLQLEDWIKGVYLSSTDRLEFIRSLPLPSSTLALPPVLDDDLKNILGSKNLLSYSTRISERELLSMHEMLGNSLNIIALIRKMIQEQPEETKDNLVGYINIVGDLLSVSMRDITGLRRQLSLSALGLRSSDMPSTRSLPLDGSVRLDPKTDEYHPNLFGSSLKEEVMAADSAVQKSIDKLRRRRSDVSAPLSSSFRKYNKRDAAPREKNQPPRRTNVKDFRNKDFSSRRGFSNNNKPYRGGHGSSSSRMGTR